MERRDTRLSRRLQGTQVTTENGHRCFNDARYESARALARTHVHSINFLDFAHRADTVKSTPLINDGAISGSVIYPPWGNADKSLKNLTPFFLFFLFFFLFLLLSSLGAGVPFQRTRPALRCLLRSVAIDSNLFVLARYVADPAS